MNFKNRIFWLCGTFVYMAALAYVSCQPGDSGAGGTSVAIRAFKNFLHIPAYAGLTYLLVRCFLKFDLRAQVLSFVIAVGYGILNEFIQATIPNRYYSIEDMVRNSMGAVLMIWLLRKYNNKNTRVISS